MQFILPNNRTAAIAIRRWVMLTHRWMGVVFCVLFLAWFASGIVMMYQDAFESQRILAAVKKGIAPASIAEARIVREYERYYVDRQNQRSLPVLYVQLSDVNKSAYYIDPRTGRVVQSYGSRSRWNRWLYHGLHSLDFPWLYAHRPAWDIVVVLLMLGGKALSITSLFVAWKVLRRKFIVRGQQKDVGELVT